MYVVAAERVRGEAVEATLLGEVEAQDEQPVWDEPVLLVLGGQWEVAPVERVEPGRPGGPEKQFSADQL